MLVVKMIKKLYDKNGKLAGYTLRNEYNKAEVMNVSKEQLKTAVLNGQCEVINMTLTSDGRLLGSAHSKVTVDSAEQAKQQKMIEEQRRNEEEYKRRMEEIRRLKEIEEHNRILEIEKQQRALEAQKRAEEEKRRQIEAQRDKSGESLLEIYTNGRTIVATLIDNTELARGAFELIDIPGLKKGITFDVGHEAIRKIRDNDYDNISIVGDKPDLSKIKRKSFKSVKPKLIKVVQANIDKITFDVVKGERKYEYMVIINEYEQLTQQDKFPINQLIHCLIEDAMISAKIKCEYINEDEFHVHCYTGIKDVRDAVKTIFRVEVKG